MGLSENKVPTESNGSLTFDLCMHEFGVSNIARQTHMYLYIYSIYINNLCLQVFAFCMVFSVLKCSHVTPKYQERCVNEWSGLKNYEAPIVIMFFVFFCGYVLNLDAGTHCRNTFYLMVKEQQHFLQFVLGITALFIVCAERFQRSLIFTPDLRW